MCNLEIIRQVQLVSKFKAGHVVMIDKQFSLEGKLLENCIRLIIPPFVRKGKQFLEEKKRTNKFRRTIPQKRVMGRVRELQHPGFECTRDSVWSIGRAVVILLWINNLSTISCKTSSLVQIQPAVKILVTLSYHRLTWLGLLDIGVGDPCNLLAFEFAYSREVYSINNDIDFFYSNNSFVINFGNVRSRCDFDCICCNT